jgi:hypothetical protein
MASFLHNEAKSEILKGNLPLETANLKVMILNASYVPDPDTSLVSAINANELNGTGYQSGFAGTGRQVLTGKAVTKDNAIDKAIFTATPTKFSTINAGVASYFVVYKVGTSDADSLIVFSGDNANTDTNGTDITADWPTAPNGGMFKI